MVVDMLVNDNQKYAHMSSKKIMLPDS